MQLANTKFARLGLQLHQEQRKGSNLNEELKAAKEQNVVVVRTGPQRTLHCSITTKATPSNVGMPCK